MFWTLYNNKTKAMGNNIFTLHIPEIGETQSIPLYVEPLEFVKGWWSTDKDGKELLKKAKLGDTVYFHVNVKGLADGQEITLKLAELDYYFGVDNIDPDDRKFPEEEVVKTAIINNGKAVVKLVLQDSWDVMIKDDSDELGNLDSTLELYWEIEYGKYKKALPAEDEDYLKVGFNDRTLFIRPATKEYPLPELLTYNGEVLVIKSFFADKYKGEAQKKVINDISNVFKNKLDNFLLTKSKKGDYLIKMDGMLFKNESLYNTNAFESAIGIDNKNIKSLSLISKEGVKLTALKFMSNLSNIFDVKEVFDFAINDIDDSAPAPLQFGPLTIISEVAGLYILSKKQEVDRILDHERQQMLLYAKSKGLKNVKNFIMHYGDETNYDLLKISEKLTTELLNGKIKTINELIAYDDEHYIHNRPVYVLYRFEKDKNKENTYNQIIESIFLDK